MIIVNNALLSSRHALMVTSLAVLALTGCGQKNELYLVDPATKTVTTSSEALASTSSPQDVAFAGIDDDEYQRTRYLEQQQVFPEVSEDPNDY